MSDLIPFDFNGASIRVINEGGNALFVAADVAEQLGYRMASDATRVLDDDEKGTRSVRTPGGEQNLAVVTEAGLYRLVMRSNKPEAKPFQKWAAKVIEQIRKTGSYGSPVDFRAMLSTPESAALALAEAISVVQVERSKRLAAEAESAAKSEALAVAKPKADWVDEYADVKRDRKLQDAGRALNVGPNLLIDELCRVGVLHHSKGELLAKAELVDRGYFVHLPKTRKHPRTGETIDYLLCHVTPKGIVWIGKLLDAGKLNVKRRRAA